MSPFTILVIGLMVAGYFLPAIIGAARNVSGAGLLFFLNLVLGWTWVAWAILLFMACTARGGKAQEVGWSTRRQGTRVEPYLSSRLSGHLNGRS